MVAKLLQDGLPLQHDGIFVLCDASCQGFPIRYASEGFCQLFGYDEADCLGEFCGMLFGGPAIKADDKALLAAAAEANISEADAARGIDRLARFADEQCARTLGRPREEVGFSLLLCRTKSGAVIVCELLMLVLHHPEHGWSYTISFLRDVTRTVQVRTVLRAAVQGGYRTLVEAWRGGINSRLARLGIGSSGDGVVDYMRDTALGLRQAMLPGQPRARAATSVPMPRLRRRRRGRVGPRACGRHAAAEGLVEAVSPLGACDRGGDGGCCSRGCSQDRQQPQAEVAPSTSKWSARAGA